MAEAGVSSAVLKAYVESLTIASRPSADEIIYLHEKGISSDVITALIQRAAELREKGIQAARQNQIYAPPPATAPALTQTPQTYPVYVQPNYVAPTYSAPTYVEYPVSYPSYAYYDYPFYSSWWYPSYSLSFSFGRRSYSGFHHYSYFPRYNYFGGDRSHFSIGHSYGGRFGGSVRFAGGGGFHGGGVAGGGGHGGGGRSHH